MFLDLNKDIEMLLLFNLENRSHLSYNKHASAINNVWVKFHPAVDTLLLCLV